MPENKMPENKYLVLAYYNFSPIEDPHAEVKAHKAFFQGRDVTSRIYISEQGINGQMSASQADARAYIDWMHTRPVFEKTKFKIHSYHEQAFPRVVVKYRKQLVAIDAEIDLSMTGEHLSPLRWQQMLNEKNDRVLIDVRNDYEWQVGHFEGAELPPFETFREFLDYANKLKEQVDPEKTPIMMYCTGGIRCEYFSSLLKEKGFEKVYQLDGGVINYGLEQGNEHWKGKLFVFDDRLTVPISDEPSEVIGKCRHCSSESESYYNCANMDCNTLFLCCPECLKTHVGCCQESCEQAPRVRPHQEQDCHKPFRRWYNYSHEKIKRREPAPTDMQQ